jgi:hypothetical protein
MSFYQTAIKKFTGKSTVFVTAAAFATICSAHTARQGANFSGDWTLNTTKSELGEMAGRVPTKLKVTQSADAITTERTSSFNGEERKTTEKITLDGKESENVVFGTSKKKSIAKWADNGQTLNLNSKRRTNNGDQRNRKLETVRRRKNAFNRIYFSIYKRLVRSKSSV